MKILTIASECVPFCKTGGLADVVGALSQRLGGEGHDVCLVLPKYRTVEAAALQNGRAQPLSVPLGGQPVKASLRYMQFRSVSVCFVDYPPFFDREGLYAREGKDHPDNDARFALLARGALEGAKALGFKPDVVHAHDWQAALAPAYLRTVYATDPFFENAATVLTIHNLAYQGNFPRASLATTGLPESEFSAARAEFYGQLSYLKAGIVSADLVTTVSPTYAREIQESSERGFGLEGVLRERAGGVLGILNGIDREAWNPQRDARVPARFSAADPSGKAACRKALHRECGLAEDPAAPLVAVVSRLDYQKGLDLAISALEPRLERLRLAVVGTGDAAIEAAFSALARRRADRVHFHPGFDDAFARRLYAACDLFLMPSRFEPCGLGQMIAMRYGGVPVATKTGGLADTIRDGVDGFHAAPGDPASLGAALDRALSAFGAPGWEKLRRAALEADFGWDGAVAKYLEAFGRAREKARARA